MATRAEIATLSRASRETLLSVKRASVGRLLRLGGERCAVQWVVTFSKDTDREKTCSHKNSRGVRASSKPEGRAPTRASSRKRPIAIPRLMPLSWRPKHGDGRRPGHALDSTLSFEGEVLGQETSSIAAPPESAQYPAGELRQLEKALACTLRQVLGSESRVLFGRLARRRIRSSYSLFCSSVQG